MKPIELYAREPARRDYDISVFFGCYFNHMPEIRETLWPQMLGPGENARVEIRYYKDHSYDGRRIWRLCAAFLDGQPFMIMQNAGREGDDHYARFVTDIETYRDAVRYVKSLAPVRFEEISDVVDENADIPTLTSFYSDSLCCGW